MHTWQLDLIGDLHAPGLARRSLRGWLELLDCSEDTKVDIVIVMSELVTRAVTSEAARVSIRMVFDDGRLRMDVDTRSDEVPTAPRDRQQQDAARPPLTDRVVDAASDGWGRTRTPHGTHTWAEILC